MVKKIKKICVHFHHFFPQFKFDALSAYFCELSSVVSAKKCSLEFKKHFSLTFLPLL